jgi:hypothetical protein
MYFWRWTYSQNQKKGQKIRRRQLLPGRSGLSSTTCPDLGWSTHAAGIAQDGYAERRASQHCASHHENRMPDAECETEVFNGFRLGGSHRVAVYKPILVSSTGPCKASGSLGTAHALPTTTIPAAPIPATTPVSCDDECTVTFSPSAVLTSSAVSTESCCDKLTVNGVQYSGSAGPNDVAASSMTWCRRTFLNRIPAGRSARPRHRRRRRRRRHVIATITRAAARSAEPRPRARAGVFRVQSYNEQNNSPGQACKCTYEGAWTCSGDNWPCNNPNSPLCATPDMSVASCILGGGDCGGYSGASDCDCAYSIAGAARSARPHPPTPHAIATTWALGHAMAKW